MLVRVAESLYWMARYLGRVEDLARLVSVNTNLLLDLPKGVAPPWRSLITIIGADGAFHSKSSADDEATVLRFLLVDQGHPQSLLASIQSARENARTLRDVLPREVWEQINALFLFAKENSSSGLTKRGRYGFLKQVISNCQTVGGLLSGCMSHNEPYQFLMAGYHIERADMTSRIIDVRSLSLRRDVVPKAGAEFRTATYENILWMSVLRSLSAYQMYRLDQQSSIKRESVLQFLLQSSTFPRAFRYSVIEVGNALKNMPRHERALAQAQGLAERVSAADVTQLSAEELPSFIDVLQLALSDLHQSIAETYFSRSVPAE